MQGDRNDRRILGIMTFRRLGRRLVGIGLLLRARKSWIRSIPVCEAFCQGLLLGLKRVGHIWLIACQHHGCCVNPKVLTCWKVWS